MKKKLIVPVLLAGMVLFASFTADAGLQNVTVGGSIEIRGNYYTEFWEPQAVERIPSFFLPYRAIGPFGTASLIGADNDRNSLGWVEQRTTINVQADFTDDVCAFIELDSIDNWGEDFRSNYITGADSRANSVDDLEVYQAYIDVNNIGGQPIRLRIGRQELKFGSEWLVGNNYYWDPLTFLSFDAIRLTYDTDLLSVDAFWAKLADRSPAEEDADTDFYGVYATLKAVPNVDLDAYYFFLRDGRSLNDTNFIAPLEWLEDAVDLDNYDPTTIHTVGLRAAGEMSGFDFELQAAYQWGEADAVGAGFVPTDFLYGDDDAEYDAWAGTVAVGYTFPIKWSPRVHVGADYYGGNDKRDISFLEWINPFHRPEASVSFNRLFSSWEDDWFLEASALSNCWIAKCGFSLAPTDKLEFGLDVLYLATLEEFDAPLSVRLGRVYIPVAPALPFLDQKAEKDLGWETAFWLTYAYSEDLTLECGWSHLFTGDAMERGAFSQSNGLEFLGGQGTDDGDYFYFGSTIKF